MIQLPFGDRIEAGRLLGDELVHRGLPKDVIVLGLARGGVPVGFGVAAVLHAPLDVVVVRKLGVPWQPELAMGAIAGDVRTIDEALIERLRISQAQINAAVAKETLEAQRRESLYRAGRPQFGVRGKTVILVDDGLATGSSMLAAVRHVQSLEPARVVVAVPVGTVQARHHVAKIANDCICLATPEPFYAVGEWYEDFRQVNDDEVQRLLDQNRLNSTAA
jgi:putative phosphoribosyl transferase